MSTTYEQAKTFKKLTPGGQLNGSQAVTVRGL